MTRVTVLTTGAPPLPALELLGVRQDVVAPDVAAVVAAGPADALVLDATGDLTGSFALARLLDAAGLRPVLAVLTEGGMAAVGPGWPVADVVLVDAGPAEVGARLRRLSVEPAADASGDPGPVRLGDLEVDEASWSARVRGRALDLTFKEFELLRHLAAHPGRVFTRDQLLGTVWGADYLGGVRTVDVHVRRLRAKLGEMEGLVETVRGVGYRARLPEAPSP